VIVEVGEMRNIEEEEESCKADVDDRMSINAAMKSPSIYEGDGE
jgi:hypothetical protein